MLSHMSKQLCNPVVPSVGLVVVPSIGYGLGHNFGTRNARKSIQPSEDSYYSLLSNKT